VKVTQQLRNQRQHCKPPLKIAEKLDDSFAMALFFMSDAVFTRFLFYFAMYRPKRNKTLVQQESP
jgi:hypothetical protein